MGYMQEALQNATLNIFYAVLSILFMVFFPKVIEIIQEIREGVDPSAPSGDSEADGHK